MYPWFRADLKDINGKYIDILIPGPDESYVRAKLVLLLDKDTTILDVVEVVPVSDGNEVCFTRKE